jgi:RNA polymerase sigma-70 factor (ECF subfamily)
VSAAALSLTSDAEILEAFRDGRRERAATAFVRRHQRFVHSVAMRHLGNTEDARDAAQDVFVRALQNIDRFKGDSSLQTWLYRITVNVCVNMRRKHRWRSFFAVGEGTDERDVVADQTGTDQAAQDAEFDRCFRSLLEQLPPKQRETFCLRYFDELSYDEMSAMLGTSAGALKANYHWAVKKLAEMLRTTEYYHHWIASQNHDRTEH